MKKKYKTVSLFSGAMGLDLGIEATSRFQLLACVEKERVFCDTIRLNKSKGRLPRNLKIFEGDISTIDPLEVLDTLSLRPGELDLLVGGPPCQSFSTAGRRGTVQDPRGTLLWQFLRFIEAMQPKFFLMENVRGLVSAALKHRPISERPESGGTKLSDPESPGSVLRLFAKDLQAIAGGYHMDVFEVNAVNYGAPQIRERVMFIGNRFGEIVDFPEPTHAPTSAANRQSSLLEQDQHELLPWKTLKDAIGDIQDNSSPVLDFSPRKKWFLSHVPPGSNWRSLPINLQKESMGKAWTAKGGRSGWWRRLTLDLPCPTLVTMPNHASTALCHPTETRALSVAEYARIQEFPRDWEFCGTLSEQYAQIGNAVPTRLGEVAGKVLASALDLAARRKWRSAASAPATFRVVYVQSHVRTRHWFRNGETLLWQGDGNVSRPSYGAAKTTRKITAIG